MKNQLLQKQAHTYDAAAFKRPPMFFRPGTLFPILCEDDLCGLTEKFNDLKAKGIGRVAPWLIPASRYAKYTGSTLGIDYDTPEYWQALKTIQAAAEASGLSVIMHDESGWPSGQAGGKILEQGGNDWIRHTLQPTASNPINAEPLEKGSINPDTPQPDLLNPDVGSAVVELVLNKHKEQLGGSLPECMPWVYADEPTFGGIGHDPIKEFIWTEGLEQRFAKRYGYRIEPFLSELTDGSLEALSPETAQARVDYFDLLAELFETNYLKPIFEWCERNQVACGGHLLLEHDPRRFMEGGYGHLLRSFRHFHIPGIDSIFQESHPHKNSHHFPKYASSIARQTGRLCSSMPFGASSCAVTPGIFKWTIDHELVRGINLFLPWGYSPNDDIHYQWSRPVFGHFGPLWQHMDIAYLYTARMSYLLSRGTPDCRTALYFDMRSIWAGEPWQTQAIEAQEAIAQTLLETQHDFDFVDDLALKEASFSSDGELVVGKMSYDTLIIPPTDWMEPAAQEVVQQFIAAGGTVLSDSTPDRPLLRTTSPQPMLRVCKRNVSGESIYFLVNEGNDPIDTTALFAETKLPEQLVAESGECLPTYAEQQNGTVHMPLSLAPWESRIVRFTEAATSSPKISQSTQQQLDKWTSKIVEQTVIQEDKITTLTPEDNDFEASAHTDWCESIGNDFTGTVRYQTRFNLTADERQQSWTIDLGDVKSACSVSLNGVLLGRKLWAPFSFKLPGEALAESNVLEVDVSNTLSNLFTSTEYLSQVDSIYSEEGARYVRILETWEKETRPSGLFGPVQLIRAT
ncbi:glycosyl hydrolase [Opitutales bacterium]|nr:glycosyl hydrolase [Opitutales bacterium]